MLQRFGSLTATLLLTVITLTALPITASPTAEESVRELLRRYFEDCLDQPGDYSCLEDYWPAEKAEGVRRGEELRRSLFPDLSYEIVEILVDGDRAAVRCKVTGHPSATAPASDGAPTLDIDEAFFYRVEDGQIRSGKPFSDRWAVAQVLGYTVSPPEPR